jgi:tRNA (guanine37-N1)-methyltransferase
MFEGFLKFSIVQRAIDKGLAQVVIHQLRDYSLNKHHRIDDYPFGGEAGMVMQIEPIVNCIETLQKECHYDEIIFPSPDAKVFAQSDANALSLKQNLIIVCGHYKGVDQRFRDHFVTKEYSIGDFVLSGGEMPAALITDAVIRLLPGAIGDETSALNDSFQNELLSYPVYTRPADFRGWKVPEVLLSGNERLIREWQQEESLKKTSQIRPEML